MAINMEEMRKKLQMLQSNQKTNAYKWKPEPGENIIRIVPYQFRKGDPFLELYFHYNVGKKKYLSLTTFEEADPIAEFAETLQNTGDKDDWKLGKKLEPTLRVFTPIIVRGKEKEGVKFWDFGKNIYMELLKVTTDPDYGDITDLVTGRDIVVEFQTPAEAKNDYGKTIVRVKPNTKKTTEDQSIMDLILTKQPDLFSIYTKPTYDELAKVLQKWLEPKDEQPTANEVKTVNEEVVEEEETVVEETKSTTAVNKTATAIPTKTVEASTAKPTTAIKPISTKDVDKAFDEMFN